MAKEIIAVGPFLKLPKAEIEGLAGPETLQPETRVSFDEVEIEIWENGLRPDLIGTLVRQQGEGPARRRLIIEVRVAHRVDERKLTLLRARNESVVEINLSRVDRDLSREELAHQILEEAPREWLYHRRVERRRLEIAQERRRLAQAREEQERQKRQKQLWAVAAAREAERMREAARAIPPRSATTQEAAWARLELQNWTLVGRAEMLSAPGDDDIFAVEPILWRALVLSVMAPWRPEADKLSFRPDPRTLSKALAQDLRARDWVKGPFAGSLRRWTGYRTEPWDPVADAVEAYFKSATSAEPSGALFRDLASEIERVVCHARETWQVHLRFAARVLRVAEAMRSLGARLLVEGSEPTTVDNASALIAKAAGRSSPDPGHWYFETIVQEAITGQRGPRPVSPVAEFEARGFELALINDQASGRTARALAAFHEQHRARWQVELENIRLTEAGRLLSVFQELANRAPELVEVLRDEGFAFLIDSNDILARIGHSPLSQAEPTLKAVQEALAPYRALAAEVDKVLCLAETAKSPRLAAFLRQEGLRIGFGRAAGRERRHLHGLRSDRDRTEAATVILELEVIGSRWGYGDDFPRRALESNPPGVKASLLDLLLGGFVPAYRRATADIRGRSAPPPWVRPS